MSINVDYNEKSGRFIIHSPFWALETMRAIPNRKFEKRLGNAWTAPALRANVEYLRVSLPTGSVFTDSARVKMNDVLNPPKPMEDPFPSVYKFKRQPREHQMEALNWVYSKRSFALFMDMRTGKTKVVIDLAMAMHGDGKIDRLVVIPLLTLRRNWEVAFHDDADMSKVDLHHLDTGRKKDFDKFNHTGDGRLKVLMVGIESLSAGGAIDMVLSFCSGPKTMAVIDESDSIKNHSAIRTQNMFKIRNKAEYRGIMTGTPISQGPMDFFAQLEFLDPNIIGIGDYYSFRNRYAIMGGFEDKEVVGYQNMSELIELTKPFVHQVRYANVFDSPPSVSEIRTVQLTDEQKVIYRSIKKDNTIRDGKDIKLIIQNVLEKMLRLQEVCGGFWAERIDTGKTRLTAKQKIEKPVFKYNHHRIPGKTPKLDACIDVLTREFKEDQGIVWTVHRNEMEMIREELSNHGTVGMLHGDVSEDDRHKLDRDFRAGKIKWIVANPQTGGRGYTFDAAYVMVNYTYSHSLIHRLQSLERATSGTKTRPVVIVDLITENTVDELIIAALTSKEDVSEYVRKALEGKKRGVDELLL
jgi:SNF2 family DNA or RNA helicase